MFREDFTRFLKDLSRFNQNELIVVTYDQSKNLLAYRQLNRIVLTPYLSKYFLPKKRFKVGVLTQSGYNKLIYNLNKLLSNDLLDKEMLIPNIGKLQIDWYRYYGSITVPTPVKYITLNLVTITNRFYTNLLCKHYNNESRTVYQAVKNEIKIKDNNKLNIVEEY